MSSTLGSNKIFGTDGVRGKANEYPMTVEVALALGRAVGRMFKRHNGRHRVIIGKDTRLSCYMFENALIAGMCSMGLDTLMVGPLPTPGVAFLTRAYRADAGVVISASHNPFYDNGIKFFSSEGFKFSEEWEKQVEELILTRHFEDCLPGDTEIGRNFKIVDADGRYIEFAKSTFPKHHSLKGLKIALDSGNGAGYRVAPLIFRELDAEVFEYGNRPDGLNINKGCGALHPEYVQSKVLEHQADVGIALDGDADRVVLVDEKGRIIDGDMMVAICAREMKKRGILKHNTVVSTVMCNMGFLKAMRREGIEVVQSQVGDRYVIQDMIKKGINLGGEQSGHVIFSDWNTTGDGLVTALQVLGIMVTTGTTLSQLANVMEKFPQTIVNVKVKEKLPIHSLPKVAHVIKEVEKLLGDSGRIFVRYSGTEKICRVMVEGEDDNKIIEYANRVAETLKTEIGE